MLKHVLVLAGGLALVGGGVAQAEQAPTGLPKQVTELKCLVGTWTGSGKFAAGKDRAQVTAHYECRESSGGFGVACHGEITGVPGMASYQWDDLWGFDPDSGKVHWFTVTNAGETHDHSGMPKGRKWNGVWQGSREGKPMVERVEFAFKNAKSFRASSHVEVDGKAAESIELKFEKRDGVAAR